MVRPIHRLLAREPGYRRKFQMARAVPALSGICSEDKERTLEQRTGSRIGWCLVNGTRDV